jgi:hypothetical protein
MWLCWTIEDPSKGAVAIKAHGNTNFVNIMLDKQFKIQCT